MGLLFNEIKFSQHSMLQPLIDLAYFALELDPGKYLEFSAVLTFCLFDTTKVYQREWRTYFVYHSCAS